MVWPFLNLDLFLRESSLCVSSNINETKHLDHHIFKLQDKFLIFQIQKPLDLEHIYIYILVRTFNLSCKR